jgi:glucosylceramidase
MYFGPHGIQFTLGRIHIGSCDFCLESYSFDDVAGDYNMAYFDDDVTHDQLQIIPMIKRAMAASPNTINLLASPWSPPAWMKVPVNGSQSMLSSADPSGLIADPRVQSAWAKYISKFITSYAKSGVPIWALTPQNEPEFAAPWEACKYNSSFESDFVNNYLGPIVKGDHPEILILAYDHNKDILKSWTDMIMSNNQQNYVDGMAFHWYFYNEDRYLDGSYGYDSVNYSYHKAPNKILLATEGCSCPGVLIDNWLRAERIAHDIIFDMLNYAQGWIDWNLIVDSEGGPNHLGNECDASMVCLADFSDVHIQPKFYFFGHFSKFVHPGDLRIDSLIVGNYNFADINVDVKYGTEVQIFPCERSTRQQWVYVPANKTLGMMKITTDGFSQWSRIINLCLSSSGPYLRQYLKVDMCPDYGVAENVLKVEFTPQGQIKDLATGYCVEVADGNTVGGGLLQLAPCRDALATNYVDQIWDFNHHTGEITTRHRNLCLTAGWPFLTGIAFMSETGMDARVTVIVMNEADISTEVILTDTKSGKDIRFGISDRSIQTIIY